MVGASGSSDAGEKVFLMRGEIVAGVEDAAIFGANGLRTVGGIMLAATGAFEVSEARHGESLSGLGETVVLQRQFRFTRFYWGAGFEGEKRTATSSL